MKFYHPGWEEPTQLPGGPEDYVALRQEALELYHAANGQVPFGDFSVRKNQVGPTSASFVFSAADTETLRVGLDESTLAVRLVREIITPTFRDGLFDIPIIEVHDCSLLPDRATEQDYIQNRRRNAGDLRYDSGVYEPATPYGLPDWHTQLGRVAEFQGKPPKAMPKRGWLAKIRSIER